LTQERSYPPVEVEPSSGAFVSVEPALEALEFSVEPVLEALEFSVEPVLPAVEFSVEPVLVAAAEALSFSLAALSFWPVVGEVEDDDEPPPTARSRLAASAAAVGLEAAVWMAAEPEEDPPGDVDAELELVFEVEEKPAAGRSARRTSI
jgi:hypothetical protein